MIDTTMIIIIAVFMVIGRVAGLFAGRAVRRGWGDFWYCLFEVVGFGGAVIPVVVFVWYLIQKY